MSLRPRRHAAAFALAVTAIGRSAAAEQPACYTIRPGDTAAYIALRFTGSVQHRYEPWFQIVDPVGARLIPKAEYGRIRPGWQTCVPETRLTVEWRRRTEIPAATSDTPRSLASLAGDASILWWSGAAVLPLTLVAWHATYKHLKRRRVTVRAMQDFAERFISEFERPLTQPGAAERPLQARVRLVPRQHRVEILLAPNGGRSYPNLTDHRRNMKYDVGRVTGLIADPRFIAGDVYADGRWVVVPWRLTIEPTQEGAS